MATQGTLVNFFFPTAFPSSVELVPFPIPGTSFLRVAHPASSNRIVTEAGLRESRAGSHSKVSLRQQTSRCFSRPDPTPSGRASAMASGWSGRVISWPS